MRKLENRLGGDYLIFNGIDLEPYFRIKDIRGRGLIKRRINGISVPGMDGEYVESIETPAKILEVDIRIVSQNLRETIDELNSIFDTNGPVPIIFPDEPDMTYYGTVEDTRESGEKVHLGRHDTTIYIRRSDPNKYGPEKEAIFPSDVFTITNEGTAEADPLFELEVLQPVTFAMIQNQNDEYMMIGRPVQAEETPFEPKTSIMNDPMNSLVGWTNATNVDGGVVSGTMATDSNGFYASDFGTGTGWHGPSMKTSLSELLQDFDAQIHVENLNLAGGMGMIEVYFLDVNENTIAKLGIADAWKDVARMQAKFQLGNPSDRYEEVGEPARHSNWYDYRGIMRIARRGQEWTAYFAIIQNGVFRYPYQMRFIDGENKYQGKIAQIQVAIRKRPTVNATSMRINHIYINKINQEQNGVPYIADVGDKIIFDHANNDILINGEPRLDLKDFGASYFKLAKGDNQLVVLPSESFNIKVKYREKYK
jgi:predicted phage tail component-like protein